MAHTPWQHDEFIKHFTLKDSTGVGVKQANTHKKVAEAIETKHIITERKVAWYAQNARNYTYAGSTKMAHLWSPALLKIKALVEKKTGASFNACLLNLYPNGESGMTWHSDNESEIVKGAPIASLSFGAVRKFMLKHKKTKKRIDLWLASGQLIVMRGSTQTHWLHAVPKTTKVAEPRINLTFRSVV